MQGCRIGILRLRNDQPSRGRTKIEKMSSYQGVGKLGNIAVAVSLSPSVTKLLTPQPGCFIFSHRRGFSKGKCGGMFRLCDRSRGETSQRNHRMCALGAGHSARIYPKDADTLTDIPGWRSTGAYERSITHQLCMGAVFCGSDSDRHVLLFRSVFPNCRSLPRAVVSQRHDARGRGHADLSVRDDPSVVSFQLLYEMRRPRRWRQ